MFEENEEQNNFYPLEEMVQPPKQGEGTYPLLKDIASIATREPQTPQEVEYNSYLDGVWNRVNTDNIALDASIMHKAVASNQPDIATQAAASIQERLRKEAQPSIVSSQEKLREVTQAVAEQIAAVNKTLLINNEPAKVAEVVDKVGKGTAALVEMQKAIEEGNTFANKAIMFGQAFATGMGSATNIAMQGIVNRAVGGEVASLATGQEEDIQALKDYYASIPDDEGKALWISNLYKEMVDNKAVGFSPSYAGLVVGKIIENAPYDNWDKFFDVLQKLGPVAEAVGLVGALRFAGKSIKYASEVNSAERAIAELGGKDIIIGAEAAKIAARGMGEVVGEVTGANAITGLYKLTSSSIKHILPESISTAPTKLQETIISNVTKAIKNLEETVTIPDRAAQIDEIKRIYSTAVNKTVARLDFDEGGTATIYFKPPNDNSFTTKEAAEAWATLNDPTGVMKLEVVPDTTNPGFLVSADARKALETELALAEAELKKLTDAEKAKRPRKGSKRAEKALTEVGEGVGKGEGKETPVEASKPSLDTEMQAIMKTVPSAKPASMAKEGDVTLWKASGMGEWVESEEVAREVARSNKGQVRAIAVAKEDVSKVNTNVEGNAPGNNGFFQLYSEPYTTMEGSRKVGSGITISKGISPAVDAFVKKLGPVLIDSNGVTRPLLILQEEDLLRGQGALGRASIQAHSDYVRDRNVGGYFVVSLDGTPTIVMKKNANTREYMQTFAHEYGHYFQHVWNKKYSGELESLFKQFLESKKITPDKIGNLSLADLAQYMGVRMVEYANRSPQKGIDATRYTPFWGDKEMEKWLQKYGEFFAENFSKWAFSDEVPTSLLGEYFSTLTKYVKQIFATFLDMFPGREPVDKGIAALMNKHVAWMKEDVARQNFDYTLPFVGEARAATYVTPLQAATNNVTRLRAQLAAISSAHSGLVHGYLVRGVIPARVPKYTDEDLNSIVRLSFDDKALGTSSEQYEDRFISILAQSRYQRLLTDLVRKPMERLSRKEKAHVDSWLIRGDAIGDEFNVPTLLTMGGNEREIEAYLTFRSARNLTYQLRNNALAKSLDGWGYKTLVHPNIPNLTFGRDVAPGSKAGFAWDADNQTMTRVTEDWWNKNPHRMVKELPTPQRWADGKESWYVVVDRGALRTTQITTAIPYRRGEYQRSYTDPYWVKLSSSAFVNKDGSPRLVAHRTATTRKDAEMYAKAYNDGIKLFRQGQLTVQEAARLMQPWGWNPADFITEVSGLAPDAKMVDVFDRTKDDYIAEGMNLGMGLGGERRDDAIQNVRGGSNTLSPTDSLATEIGNTAYVANVTAWRDQHIKLWYNTFKDTLPPDLHNLSPEDAFFKHISRRQRYGGNDKFKINRQRIENYLLENIRVPTHEELITASIGRQMAEIIEGKWQSKPTLLLGGLLRRTQDFPTFYRTVAFHSYFGFNPFQTLMQSMNAFNAIAISPIHGSKAAGTAALLRIALMSDQESIWRGVAKFGKLSTLGLAVDANEFVQLVRTVRRSGLLDGINTTSLYGDKTGKLGLYNKWLRRAGAVSAAPFNLGEEVSRLVSFDIARREYKAANPGRAWWDDVALRTILPRQDDLTQNMTTANTALWQRGLLSIPTQFFQYPVKLMLNLAAGLAGNNRTFTRKEVAQLLTMHLLFLGTAGFWMPDAIDEGLSKWFEDNDVSPEVKLTVTQGIVAGAINQISLAYDNEKLELGIGSRLGTFNFYQEFVDGLFDPEKPAIEVLAGASGAAGLRAFGAVGKALAIYAEDPLSYEAMETAAEYLLTGALSSVNNYNKGIVAGAYDYMLSKSGERQYYVNKREQFFQKFGIPAAAKTDLDVLWKTTADKKKLIKEESRLLAELRTRALIAIKDGDEAQYDLMNKVIQARLAAIDNLNDRQAVNRNSWSIVVDTQSKQSKLMQEILFKYLPNSPVVNTYEVK